MIPLSKEENLNLLNKVAKVSLLFWALKILATTLGETAGDMLSMTLNMGYTKSLLITLVIFSILLVTQLKMHKHKPAIYWLVIVGTTTLGTEISDFMDRTLGLGYALGTTILFTGLVGTLYIWYKRIGKLEVYPIFKKNEELLYWIAILFSNSLGTAFGDFLSDNMGLSYLQGAGVTASVILIVILLHFATKINHIILFWIAFIFTRPFGATFGDLLTKPLNKGGLDLGTIPATVVTAILMILIILYASRKTREAIT